MEMERKDNVKCPKCGSKNTGGDFGFAKVKTPTLRGMKIDYEAGGKFICYDCGFEDEV